MKRIYRHTKVLLIVFGRFGRKTQEIKKLMIEAKDMDAITTFLIQARLVKNAIIPAQDFGLTFVEAIEFKNWFRGEQAYSFVFVTGDFTQDMFLPCCVPIGSVEFCLSWYKQMTGQTVLPLNIPQQLWHFCTSHKVMIANCLEKSEKQYFMKDCSVIKCDDNRVVTEWHGGSRFFSEIIEDVDAEWRIFVLRGKIRGIRCYLGSVWAAPDKTLIETIASEYGRVNPSFTLDVMVTGRGTTEILELHDFFACGLYGFTDYETLLNMAVVTKTKLLYH